MTPSSLGPSMNVDLLGSIELTASAAIVIAALSIAFGSNTATRIRSDAWLSAWFVLVVILAATRALYYEHGLGTPGLGLAVALPIASCAQRWRACSRYARAFTGCRCGCSSAYTWFVCWASVLSFFMLPTVCRRRSSRLLVGPTSFSERRLRQSHE